MRIVLSYFLLFTLALSGLTGSVQNAYASTLADALAAQHQHSVTDQQETPCHQSSVTSSKETDHSCCEQEKHQCQGDCCAKHCATASALISTELFRYVRPFSVVAADIHSLPQWLFAEDPPPPIIA